MFESCRAHFGVPVASGSEPANGTANTPARGAAHLRERPVRERFQVDYHLRAVCVKECDQPEGEDDHGQEERPGGTVRPLEDK